MGWAGPEDWGWVEGPEDKGWGVLRTRGWVEGSARNRGWVATSEDRGWGWGSSFEGHRHRLG